jgi:hypothetical protein
MKSKITIYVRSMKVPMGETLVEELYPIKRGYRPDRPGSRDTFFQVKRKKVYGYVLPDDQNALIEDVKRLCKRYGLELKIIDVSKEDAFDPFIFLIRLWRIIKGIKNFPVVETNRGIRLRAPFTQSELERFFSLVINSSERESEGSSLG